MGGFARGDAPRIVDAGIGEGGGDGQIWECDMEDCGGSSN